MTDISSSWKQRLQSAKPRLISRVEFLDKECTTAKCAAHIRMSDDLDWDELIDEGYDPRGVVGPTYWRIVRRGGELLYLSTVSIPRDGVINGWGREGLAYCDPLTGMAVIRIETFLEQA